MSADRFQIDERGYTTMATWGLYRHSNPENTPKGKQFRAFEQLAAPHKLTPRQWLAALARWRHWSVKVMGDQYHGQLYDWMRPTYDNLIRRGYTEPLPLWSAWTKKQENTQ